MFCYNITRTFALVILCFSYFVTLSAQKFEIHQVYMSNGGGEVRTVKIKAADNFSLKKNVCSWVKYEELSDGVQLIATRNTSKNSRSCKFILLDDSGFSTDTLEIIQTGRLSGTVSKVATNTVGKAANLSGATTTTVTLTLPDANTWKYDKVAFSIKYAGRTYFDDEQVGAAAGSANTFNIALGNLPTGYVYNCLITAQYQMTTVSYPFTIYLTD